MNSVKRRIISGLVVCSMVLTGFAADGFSSQTFASSFSDTSSHWAKESIEDVTSEGLFTGTSTTTFSPNESITRGMFVTVLGRLAGVSDSTVTSTFTDVSSDAYYAPYVAWAVNNNIASGTSSTTFSPTSNITREQMATFIYNYINEKGISGSTSSDTTFSDISSGSSYAQTAISTVTALGLMSGRTDGTFDPQGTATRAEAAAVIQRIAQLIGASYNSDEFLSAIMTEASSISEYSDYTEADYQEVQLNGSSISFDGEGAEVSGSDLIITEAGTYVISGTLNDGAIIVDSEEEENVNIVLKDATITCEDGAPIYVKNCGKNVIISVLSGTSSTLTDGSTYSYSYIEEDEPSAAIFSNDDLRINGTGTLTINAKYKDGIAGKDDVAITQTNLIINAADDGIVGKDSVVIGSGSITVNAGGDGIKATNSDDISKGYIGIADGILDITAENDGLQAETTLYIAGGTYDLYDGQGSSVSKSSQGGESSNTSSTTTDESESAKALKAAGSIVVTAGTFTIDCEDDAVHSNGTLEVKNGTFNISAGDDGMHADTSLAVSGGKITITKCYEGIESADITISGGTIDLTASDDGINVAGGNDSSSLGRPGENNFTSTSSNKLTISGGTLDVNATGDGLDMNGSGYMTGGTVTVSGPTNNGNAALDYDGAFEVSGGTLLIAGSSGMAQAPSSGSTQYAVATDTETQAAETTVKLLDSSGNTVLSWTPEKEYTNIVISSALIKSGQTYTIVCGSTEITNFTASSVVTNLSSSQEGTGGGMTRSEGTTSGGGITLPGGQSGPTHKTE